MESRTSAGGSKRRMAFEHPDHAVTPLFEPLEPRLLLDAQIGTLGSSPDLTGVVGWDTMPATVRGGDFCLFRADVTNGGDGQALGSMELQVWLSGDGDLSTGTDDYFLGDSPVYVILSNSQTANFFVTGTVPNNIAVGTYQLVLVVDAHNQILETNESNNQANIAAAATVVVVPPAPPANLPNLTGVVGWRNMPATVQQGDIYLYRVDVTNGGTGQATGPTEVRLWLSGDGTLGGSDDFFLGDTTAYLVLPAGQTTSCWIVGTVPNGATAGPFYLVAVVDAHNQILESNESNNQSSIASAASVSLPDLAATFSSCSLPASPLAGTWGYVLLSVTNSGAGRAWGPGDIQLWAFPLGPGTVRLLTTANWQPFYLMSGWSTSCFISFTLPSDISGNYALRAIVDSSGRFAESSEANNTVLTSAYNVQQAYIDLTGAAATPLNPILLPTPPASVTPGSFNLIELRVQNAGNVTASGFMSVQLWASLDGDLSAGSDDWSLTMIHPYVYIPAGGTGYYYFAYFAPSIPAGTYDLIAVLDSADDLTELDEANNLVILPDRFAA